MREVVPKVFDVLLEIRIRVHVDDIKLHLADKKLVQQTTEHFQALISELTKMKLDLSLSEGEMEGKNKVDDSNGQLRKGLENVAAKKESELLGASSTQA